jgi:hypothetical protein
MKTVFFEKAYAIYSINNVFSGRKYYGQTFDFDKT